MPSACIYMEPLKTGGKFLVLGRLTLHSNQSGEFVCSPAMVFWP